MLRPFLLLGAFLFVVNAFGQTLIPNANFEQFLVDEGIDTNGITGDILNADAAAVTNLNVTRNDITDFTGLEAFVNVVTLNLGQNNFLTAPMTTLTLLEEFVFDDNDILDNLDLTQNINLRILNIGTTGSGTNASTITDLDLSQNMVLETIYIYAFLDLANLIFPQTATITQIDVIGIEEDVFDFTNHSGLVDLGLNQNTSTTSILLPADKTNLMFLDIRNMGVNNIDLDGYNALERVSLRGTSVETLNLPTSGTLNYLFISGHRLPSVYDLSSVPNIVDLTIESNELATAFNVNITALTSLVTLDLKTNKMTNLDITQSTLLEDVNVSNNQLPTFDLSQNTLLTDLNASSNLITTLDLSQNVALEELNLTSNELPTLDVSTNILLENLLLGFNELPTLDVTNNPELFRLNISNNLFTTTGLDLTQNPELDNFNASNNQIESLNISQNPRMGTLLLSNNLFTGTDIIDQYHTIWSNQGALGASDRLDVSFNQLSGQIPDFASLIVDRRTNYFEFQFNDNNFEFGDFEDQHTALVSALTDTWSSSPFLPFWRDYDYAPQAKVNAIENLVRNAGESITLTTTVRGAQNHYTWFKDGVEIPDAPDAPELVLENLNTCDAGVYYTEITSDLVPFENANPPGTNGKNLLLVRNDITLTINATKTCATLDMPLTNVPINAGIQWIDNPGACGYRISLGTTSGNDDLLPLTDVGEVTVYNHPTDFATNQDIFVTIIPYYDDGDFTCTEQSFRTNASSTIPDCTMLLSPTNGNTNVAVDVSRITWNPANGADEYDVTVSSPSNVNDITTTVTDNFLDFSNDFANGETVTITIVPSNTLGNATGCLPQSFTIVKGIPPTSSGDAFITTWETTAVNETITIPTNPLETYNYTVDWGDGDIDTNVAGDATHTYATPGVHTVEITETFPAIQFAVNPLTSPAAEIVNAQKILTVEQWGNIEWTTLANAFQGCSVLNITNPSIDAPDLTNVQILSEAFRDCTNFNGDITNWDVSGVTNMFGLFHDAASFNQNIGGWTVSSVNNMSRLFEGASVFNQDIRMWTVGNVTNMGVMFAEAAQFNQDISGWNVSGVTDMNTMFAFATSFNQNIGGWTVGAVDNMNQMFLGATAFNQDIGGWDVSSVEQMIVMFQGATSFDQDLGGWNVENVTAANNMFSNVTISVANYEALLIGWNARNLQPNVVFGGGFSQYCSQAAADAKANMETSDMWNITDGGREGENIAFDALADVNTTVSYTLPAISGSNLTGNERYYTQPDGGGTEYDAGDTIQFIDFPSYPITLYVFDTSVCASKSIDFELTITLTSVPGCTNLAAPMNGATNIAVDIAQISWNLVLGATGYRLTIDSSISDANEVMDLVVTGTSHPLTDNFVNGETVTVTIVPFNADGDAVGCTPQSFTIVSDASMVPNCTMLSAPVDGATDIAIDLTQISWDAIANADGYRLTINGSTSDVNDETTLVVNRTSHPFVNAFEGGETVTVTIVPFNANGDAVGCTPESFTIISDIPMPPDCTSLSNPVDGATDVAVDTTLEWNPANGAEGYRIAIGTTDGGIEIFEGDVALLTSYTPANPFDFETTIYITITPYNIQGNAIGCTSESFTTIAAIAEPEPESEILFGFSPDGDGINEYWEINGIENYPDNVVSIFNRWGDMVFKIQGYDNGSNVFNGEANQMTNMGAGTLPEGTYFFQIQLPENHTLQTSQGYLVLKR